MAGKKWTEEENALLAELYPNTGNVEIAKRINRPIKAIQVRANSFGLYKTAEYMDFWTPEQDKIIEDLYPDTDDNIIAEIISRSPSSVVSRAFLKGITKSQKHTKQQQIKHSFRDDYFHDIDTPEKAYWLGWMWSDGCVQKSTRNNTYQIKLCLNEKDRIILDKLKYDTNASQPIFEYKNARTIQFYSEQMYDDLISHGVIPSKSLFAEEPIGVPSEFLSHFVRGEFEGDGCIHISQRGRTPCFNIVGTEIFCRWLNKTIFSFLGVDCSVRNMKCKSNLTWVYSTQSIPKIKKIAEWLYQDCGKHKLERKYNKFLERGLL